MKRDTDHISTLVPSVPTKLQVFRPDIWHWWMFLSKYSYIYTSFYFISIFPSFFFFELLRFDECYAINLPYFIIWQVDNTSWQFCARKQAEQNENNLIDSTSNLLSNTNYVCRILLDLMSVLIKQSFVSELDKT
jgi:hypothetical protein